MSSPTFTVLFCDGAVNNGKWNLIGVFDKAWLKSFPGSIPPYFVFLQITDMIIGDGAEVRIELVESSPDDEGNMRNDLIWGADVTLTRGPEMGNGPFRGGVALPIVHTDGALVTIPRPGDYEVRVLYNRDLQSITLLPFGLKGKSTP